MNRNKKEIAPEQKVQEQFKSIHLDGSAISEVVAQKILTSLQDNIQLYRRRI